MTSNRIEMTSLEKVHACIVFQKRTEMVLLVNNHKSKVFCMDRKMHTAHHCTGMLLKPKYVVPFFGLLIFCGK